MRAFAVPGLFAVAAIATLIGKPALAAQYPSPMMPALHIDPTQPQAATWSMKGDRSIRPARIRDDGSRTYLEWRPEQPLPAVFAISPTGAEEVVDGYMRGEVFIIDRVHARLVFRIDRDKAVASRIGAAR